MLLREGEKECSFERIQVEVIVVELDGIIA
jgi:hypothetical protein